VTSSQWLDIAVLGVAFVAAISGWRSGALGSLMSFVGVVLGAVAGVMLAPHIVSHVQSPRGKLFAALFLILALVVIGEVAGVVLGRAVRGAISSRVVRTVDSLIGVVLQIVVVLVAAWLLAAPLTSSDQPNLAAAVRGSKVLAEVDRYAPEWLKSVPKRMSTLLRTSGLPDVLQPFGRTPIQAVDAPDAALADGPVVAKARESVVKIRGVAPGCQKVLEGTGFVIAPNRVMSNAHVVAGSDSVTVESGGQNYDAIVVSYDPNEDISILDVPNLPVPHWCSPKARPRAVPTRWCSAIPAVVSSPRPRRGSARPSSSTVPTSIAAPPSTARCTPSEARCAKAIRAGR